MAGKKLYMDILKKSYIVFVILSTCIGCGAQNRDAGLKLYEALYSSNYEAVKEILEENPDINLEKLPKSEETVFSTKDARALGIALSDTMIGEDIIELLIQAGADVNSVISDETYLMAAIHRKEIAELLLTNGADVHAENENGETALDILVSNGDNTPQGQKETDEMETLLLSYGSQISAKTLEKCVELHSYENATEMLLYLIKNGIETECSQPLTNAILGDNEALQQDVENGNISEEEKDDIIFFASANCNIKTLQTLKEKGFSFDIFDEKGNLPFHVAVQNNTLDVVKYFISEGICDINEKTEVFEENALTLAVVRGDDEIGHWLLENGLHWQKESIVSTWVWACQYGNKQSISFLVKHHYKPTEEEIVNGYGYANEETLEALLEHDIDYNVECEEETPLDLLTYIDDRLAERLYEEGASATTQTLRNAILNGNIIFAKKLVGDGVEIDGECYPTPLETAVYMGYLDIVQFLVENGSDINKEIRSEDGITYTVLDVAKECPSERILVYLQEEKVP